MPFPSFFSRAIIINGSAALLLNGLEPYGILKNIDAHFERRTKSTLHQSFYPRKESKYGWITIVTVEDDNTRVKIGFLTCNLLVISSLQIDKNAVTTNGVVEFGPKHQQFLSKIYRFYLLE